MQKYYIYNNKAFNEFLTTIQSETQPNILLSYTTIEYPYTRAGYIRCFDSNTNTWSEQIEDNRNKIVYNINDSTITKMISELGPIPVGFTTVKPTDNVSKKFDTTKNEWYLEVGLTQIYYSDIKNKPTIPTKLSQLNNDAEFITLDDLSAYHEVTSIQFADYTHYKCTVPQTNIQLNLTQIPDTVCVFSTGDTVEYTVSFIDGMNVNKPFEFEPNKTYAVAIDNYLVVWDEIVSGE